MSEFYPNQSVIFGLENGSKVRGIVKKVNLKSIKIESLDARGKHPAGTIWNVQKSLVQIFENASNVERVKEVLKEAPLEYNMFAGMENKLLEILSDAYCGLSPENLSQDGEASHSHMASKRRELTAIITGISKTYTSVYGKPISEDRVFQWETSKRKFQQNR